MKMFRNILLVVLGLVVVLFLVGFLLPRNVHVERSAVIDANPSLVFNVLLSPAQFSEWSPWSKLDTNMKREYFGPPTGVGAGFSWEGNSDVGKGTWKISAVEPMKKITVSLDFVDMGVSTSEYLVSQEGSGTKVTWTMDSDMGFWPMGRYFGLMFDSWVGADYEKGLANLQTFITNMPKGRVDKIEEQNAPSFYYLSVREKVATNAIGEMLGRTYGSIMGYVGANKLEVAAFPFAFYHFWPSGDSKEPADVEAAIPITTLNNGAGAIKGGTFTGGPIVIAYYYGPYDQSEIAHIELYAWAKQNGKTLGDVPWEVYVTDPQEEPDPTKVLTMVCYRVNTTKPM